MVEYHRFSQNNLGAPALNYLKRNEALLDLLNRINRATHSDNGIGCNECCSNCPYRFDPLLDRTEAWAYTGFTPGTYAVWDCLKRYDLKPIRFKKAVRYRLSTLNRFADDKISAE